MEEEKSITAKRTAKPTAKRTENPTENMKGGLWLTAMGRIVLDDHSCETFSEPGDKKIMTSEELTKGIWSKEFYERLHRYIILEKLK